MHCAASPFFKSMGVKNYLNQEQDQSLFLTKLTKTWNPNSFTAEFLTRSGLLQSLHATINAPSCYLCYCRSKGFSPEPCQHRSNTEPRQQLSLKTLLALSLHNKNALYVLKGTRVTCKEEHCCAETREQSVGEGFSSCTHPSRAQQVNLVKAFELPRPWLLPLWADG